MKIDYTKTIEELKANGLIESGDKYAVAFFKPESSSNGITTTVTTSKFDYILTANEKEIKLFDIEKKTGKYLDSYLVFSKDDIVYTKKRKERRFIYASKTLFRKCVIGIRFISEDFNHDYVLPKKMHGYEQKQAVIELYNFVKEVYNTYYDELSHK